MKAFIKSKWRVLLISLSLSVALISAVLLIAPGLPIGIDFSSGSAITYQWPSDNTPAIETVRTALANAGHQSAVVQSLGDTQYFIRTADLGATGKADIDAALTSATGATPTTLDVSSVSSVVAAETVTFSIIAVSVAALLVMVYIMWAFRAIPRFHRYAFATVIALGHDVLITMGLFVLYGYLFGAAVNTPFVIAILTVIGYSVNDTIVVFDRVRENVKNNPGRAFRGNANSAIRESVIRSLGTSVTTLFVALALLLFGGSTLRDFLLVLSTGIVLGTYSSIFVATSILIFWEERPPGRFLLAFIRRMRRPAV